MSVRIAAIIVGLGAGACGADQLGAGNLSGQAGQGTAGEGAAGAGGGGGGTLDAGASDAAGDSGASGAGGTAPAPYHGVVLAFAAQGGGPDTFAAFADFQPGSDPFPWVAQVGDHPVGGSCACLQGIATPSPFGMPSPGTIAISGPNDGLVARLDPYQVTTDGGTWSTSYSSTSDLGSVWYAYAGSYPFVGAAAWRPGDTLAVSASGGSVPAFSGEVVAGAWLAGVAPSLSNGSLVIPRDSDFQISWTPDTLAGQTVLLAVTQIALDSLVSCFCAAPDQAGAVTLPASLVDLYASDPMSCGVQLERLNVSQLTLAQGTIQLVVATAVQGTATVQ